MQKGAQYARYLPTRITDRKRGERMMPIGEPEVQEQYMMDQKDEIGTR